jgi:multiple sugar transport system substrate-binding protein
MGYALALGSTGSPFVGHDLLEYLVSSVTGASTGKYFDDAGQIAFQREDLLRSAKIVKDLYASKAVSPSAVQYGVTEVHDGLRSATIAMATFGLYRFKTIMSQGAGDDLGWAPPPGITSESPQSVYGYTLGINSQSTRKDAAWEFIKFMTTPESQALMARGGEVVARKSAYKDPFFATPDAQNQKAWSELVLKRGKPVTYSIFYTYFGDAMSTAFSRMVLEGTTPDAAVDEVLASFAESVKKNS